MNWLREHKRQVESFLIGVLVLGFVLLFAAGVYLYRQRMATEAMIADRRQEAIQSQAAQETANSLNTATEEIMDFRLDQETVTWKGKEYKRNNYIKAILCMGIDRSDVMTEHRELGEAGQADGVFLLAQDTARNQVKILMVPRDTITEIRVINKDGSVRDIQQDHLSLSFANGDGMHESSKNTAYAVSELFYGLEIDHYFAADMAAIQALNDAVGGVTVTVPMYGMEKAGEVFKPGEELLLTGDLAERFIRYRDTNTDHSAVFRMNQQKEYITGYFTALQESSKKNSRIVEELFILLGDYMVTDLSKDEYMKIALDTIANDGFGDDSFRMVPGNSIVGAEYDEFYINDLDTIPLILELFYREAQ